MEGLVNFLNDIAIAGSWLLPTACYIAACMSFIYAVWGMWQQSQPQNPFVGKPWVPYVALVLSGAFAAFDRILTKAAKSAKLDMQVSLNSSSPTGYTGNTSPISGAGPHDAILQIVKDFSLFFQTFGAWVAFFALISWQGAMTGKNNRTKLGLLCQFALGVVLLNPVKEANWLLSYWPN
ncbi:hypothetical protein [Acetobacter senegalensis]